MKPFLMMLLPVCLCAVGVRAQTTIAEDDRWAWEGNTGWVDFRGERPTTNDGVRVFDAWLGGYAWSPNIGWINFGDGFPQSALKYSNANNFDFGVNHDGAGNLSGLAWSPNVGWINFGWSTNNDPNRPRIDLTTGDFAGYAWGANIGWVNLETGNLRSESIVFIDTDNDGISDPWERGYTEGGGTATLGSGDHDDDGISDLDEYLADTNPNIPGGGVSITDIERLIDLNAGIFTWSSSPARVYVAEYTIGIPGDPWQYAETYAGSPSNTTTEAFVTSLTNLYLRVWAKLPLTP